MPTNGETPTKLNAISTPLLQTSRPLLFETDQAYGAGPLDRDRESPVFIAALSNAACVATLVVTTVIVFFLLT